MTAAPNVKIRPVDMRIIDRVFGMEGGYVLDFSNRTFAEFFHEELGVDIYDDRSPCGLVPIDSAPPRKPHPGPPRAGRSAHPRIPPASSPPHPAP